MHSLGVKLNTRSMPNLKWLSWGGIKHITFGRSIQAVRKSLVLDFSQFCSFFTWIWNSSPYLCSKILESQPQARIAHEKWSHHELKGLQNSLRLLVGWGYDCLMRCVFNFIWYLIAKKERMVVRIIARYSIHKPSLVFPCLHFLGLWNLTWHLFFGYPSYCNL